MKSVRAIQRVPQQGMSLVEVMVALLVLGIGVMGYAALQLRSVKLSEDTYSRSQAMSIAQDAIERVRANFNALETYVNADWPSDPPESDGACTFTGQAPTVDTRCTPEQLASADINELKRIANSMLPSGSIAVESCNQLACVTVAWNTTTAADCDEEQIENDDRGGDGHCVTVSFQ